MSLTERQRETTNTLARIARAGVSTNEVVRSFCGLVRSDVRFDRLCSDLRQVAVVRWLNPNRVVRGVIEQARKTGTETPYSFWDAAENLLWRLRAGENIEGVTDEREAGTH